MRVLIVGGTGLIGKAIVQELSGRHEVVTIGHKSGQYQVDISNPESIETLYQSIGSFDALVSASGKVSFVEFSKMTARDFQFGLNDKLMGQVYLVQLGLKYIRDRGSFTLTSGILNHDPIRTGSSAAMVNGALEGFVKCAAIEMDRGIRINLVSPTVISEAMDKYAPYFRGYLPTPAANAALAYAKSVEGYQTGQIYKVGY